jgi:hypothetical protein
MRRVCANLYPQALVKSDRQGPTRQTIVALALRYLIRRGII